MNDLEYSLHYVLNAITEYKQLKPRTELYEKWKKAFDEYNSDHPQKLGMGCIPCYRKVFDYINKKK
jgi:hypothetical protein